jgi:hypothetical protein
MAVAWWSIAGLKSGVTILVVLTALWSCSWVDRSKSSTGRANGTKELDNITGNNYQIRAQIANLATPFQLKH